MTPSIHVSDDRLEHVSASQAQILKVLELMDCEEGYESSVRRLPHIDVRRHVQYENELDAATIQRIDNVFLKGIKSNDLGKVKISVDGVFVRLDELQLQKAIRLSELPLAGKIRAVYQTIGSKTKAPRAVGYKRGRLQEDGGPTSRQKKARVTYEELDFEKNLSKWKKPKLEAYLSHHKIAMSVNKPELFRRVSNHMHTTTTEQQ